MNTGHRLLFASGGGNSNSTRTVRCCPSAWEVGCGTGRGRPAAGTTCPLQRDRAAMMLLRVDAGAADLAHQDIHARNGAACNGAWDDSGVKQASAHLTSFDRHRVHPAAVAQAERTTALSDWVAWRLSPDADVYSDGLGAFRARDAEHAHTVIEGSGRNRCEEQDTCWFNVLLSSLKCCDVPVFPAKVRASQVRRSQVMPVPMPASRCRRGGIRHPR